MTEPAAQPTLDTSRRRRRRRAAVASVAAVLALAVCEGALRAALGTRFVHGARALRPQDALGRHDPDLGWALRPDVSTPLLALGASYRVSTNARGFRGAEIAEPRVPGRPRVVVLGDSYAFGWGVDDGETFSDLLAARLGADVANLAVPGYSTDQQLWTFEREGMRLRPDVVLLQFCFNDPEANETTFAHQYLKPRFERDAQGAWEVRGRPVATFVGVGAAEATWSEAFAARSALWAVVSGTLPLRAPAAEGDAAGRAAMQAAAGRMGPDSVTVMLLRRLASRCGEIGARLVVVDASAPGRVERPLDLAGRDTLLSPISRRLAEIARDAGFVTTSVDRALLDAASRGETVTIPDGHWNAAGHRVVAETLAEHLAPMLAK